MGYYQRRAGQEVGRLLAIIVGLAAISFWPWLLGTYIATHNGAAKGSTTYNLAGWLPEIAWIALVIALVIRQVRAAKERAESSVQQRMQLGDYRAQMARNNAPWFDVEAGHFRHSTCTIKHRSIGAAGRCSSRI